MTKLYYTDPLAAIYMQEHYKLSFVHPKLGNNRCRLERDEYTNWLIVDAEPGYEGKLARELVSTFPFEGKVYVHPDDYHVFEPQVGDLVQYYDNQEWDYFENVIQEWTGWTKEDVNKIIQRNDKPFFMPKVEELE